MGLPAKQNWGLGYQGVGTGMVGQMKSKGIENFVKGIESKEVSKDNNQRKFVLPSLHEKRPRKNQLEPRKSHSYSSWGCCLCGKNSHTKRNCFTLQNRVKRAWRLNQCFIEPKRFGKVWISKSSLYATSFTVGSVATYLMCNLARTVNEEPQIVRNVAYKNTKEHQGSSW